MATYETFEAWAERNDLSLDPGFQQRTRGFIGADGVEEVVVFPVAALAVYRDDELAAVFPCSDGERTYTVERALEAFEQDDTDWLDGVAPDATDTVEPASESATAD